MSVHYQQRQAKMTIEEIEKFVRDECRPFVGYRINILAEKILAKKKMQDGGRFFGPTQARELALRMFERTGGDILL